MQKYWLSLQHLSFGLNYLAYMKVGTTECFVQTVYKTLNELYRTILFIILQILFAKKIQNSRIFL